MVWKICFSVSNLIGSWYLGLSELFFSTSCNAVVPPWSLLFLVNNYSDLAIFRYTYPKNQWNYIICFGWGATILIDQKPNGQIDGWGSHIFRVSFIFISDMICTLISIKSADLSRICKKDIWLISIYYKLDCTFTLYFSIWDYLLIWALLLIHMKMTNISISFMLCQCTIQWRPGNCVSRYFSSGSWKRCRVYTVSIWWLVGLHQQVWQTTFSFLCWFK